jgi:DNA primase
LLKRFVGAGRIVLVFDGDAAGQKAAERTRPVFEQLHSHFKAGSYQGETGINTLILELPQGHDPDSFLRRHGPEAFVKLAGVAKGMVAFLIDAALRKHGDSIEGRALAAGELIGPLQAVNDPVTRALYVKLLAEKVGVDESAILRRLGRGVTAPQVAAVSSLTPPPSRLPALERQLTAMMLQYPPALAEVDKRNLTSYFKNFQLKAIAETALARFREAGTAEGIIDRLGDPELQRLAAALTMTEEPWNASGCHQLIIQFENTRSRPTAEMLAAITSAEQAADDDCWTRLLRERQQAAQQRERAKRELLNG